MDNKFIIKTINQEEMQILFSMLDEMIKYFKECNNNSYLARIYGVFSLKTNIFDNLNVIVMQSTIQMNNTKNPKMVFDIKGSWIKRHTKLSD